MTDRSAWTVVPSKRAIVAGLLTTTEASPSLTPEPANAAPRPLTLFSLSWKPEAWAGAMASAPRMPSARAEAWKIGDIRIAETLLVWSCWSCGGATIPWRMVPHRCPASRPGTVSCRADREAPVTRCIHVRRHPATRPPPPPLGHAPARRGPVVRAPLGQHPPRGRGAGAHGALGGAHRGPGTGAAG